MKLGIGRSVSRKNDGGDALPFDPASTSLRVALATTTYLEEEVVAVGVLEDAKKELKGKPRS
jgi:hypothetical protein